MIWIFLINLQSVNSLLLLLPHSKSITNTAVPIVNNKPNYILNMFQNINRFVSFATNLTQNTVNFNNNTVN